MLINKKHLVFSKNSLGTTTSIYKAARLIHFFFRVDFFGNVFLKQVLKVIIDIVVLLYQEMFKFFSRMSFKNWCKLDFIYDKNLKS